jgi:hypothetical protein
MRVLNIEASPRVSPSRSPRGRGQTAFTRTPKLPSSTAYCFVRRMIAALQCRSARCRLCRAFGYRGDCVARRRVRKARGRNSPKSSPLFKRYGYSSGVRAPASGSWRQQQLQPRSPRSGRCAIEAHLRSRAYIGRSMPRPWPERCMHSLSCLSADPISRQLRGFDDAFQSFPFGCQFSTSPLAQLDYLADLRSELFCPPPSPRRFFNRPQGVRGEVVGPIERDSVFGRLRVVGYAVVSEQHHYPREQLPGRRRIERDAEIAESVSYLFECSYV